MIPLNLILLSQHNQIEVKLTVIEAKKILLNEFLKNIHLKVDQKFHHSI